MTRRISLPALVAAYALGIYVASLNHITGKSLFWIISVFAVLTLVLAAILVRAFIKNQDPKCVFVAPLLCLAFLSVGLASVVLLPRHVSKQAGSKGSKDVTSSVSRYLPRAEAGLMAGILFGDTTDIPEEVKEDFKRTGLAHILAVSGMNVSMLATAAIFVAGLLPIPAIFRFAITISSLCVYMTITGLTPSVLRAGIMFTAAMLASFLSRIADPLSVLSLAAFVTLVYDPAFLFNIGWQLSFSATLFIILLSPVLIARSVL